MNNPEPCIDTPVGAPDTTETIMPTQDDETSPTAAESCDADAFMDEDDAEAVAERLRQLGYL